MQYVFGTISGLPGGVRPLWELIRWLALLA